MESSIILCLQSFHGTVSMQSSFTWGMKWLTEPVKTQEKHIFSNFQNCFCLSICLFYPEKNIRQPNTV